jgi:MraZ protein
VVQAMFMGEYQHTLDDKGRLTIPSKFRTGLGERFVATKGFDGCLFLYPVQEWEQIGEKLKSLPFTRADARGFTRLLFSGAVECEIDKQGRIVVPPSLRDYAHIDKDAVLIGVSSRVEIWSQAGWEAYQSSAEASYEELAEQIQVLGL